MGKVIIMSGTPGSGKSTYIKENFPEAVICSADSYFNIDGQYKFDGRKLSEAHGSCLKMFIESILSGKELIALDNTNTTVIEITPYVSIAFAYGYEVNLTFLHGDLDKCASRNVHNVSRETIERMMTNHTNLLNSIPKYWNVSITEITKE